MMLFKNYILVNYIFLLYYFFFLLFVFFFFFSSRRRHTRLTCDWSSDVCSSDLAESLDRARSCRAQPPVRDFHDGGLGAHRRGRTDGERPCRHARARTGALRSEERRVGKSVDLGGRRRVRKKREGKERRRESGYA